MNIKGGFARQPTATAFFLRPSGQGGSVAIFSASLFFFLHLASGKQCVLVDRGRRVAPDRGGITSLDARVVRFLQVHTLLLFPTK